ncbi:hypothetical protein [Aminobacter aminovorans]|nr:hypothetical protein [Aminobacter aminovorans]
MNGATTAVSRSSAATQDFTPMLDKFLIWFSWIHAAIGAGAITLFILYRSFFHAENREENVRFLRQNPMAILWIFAGAFTAIMISVGLVDRFINGYRTGELF